MEFQIKSLNVQNIIDLFSYTDQIVAYVSISMAVHNKSRTIKCKLHGSKIIFLLGLESRQFN